MKNGWTAERKAKQAAAIQKWKPWTRATGPKTLEGKAKVARNSWKGGKRLAFRASMRELRTALCALNLYEHLLD